MAFTLNLYPWIYQSQFSEQNWSGGFIQKSPLSPKEENQLNETERSSLAANKNSFPDLPLINYTTQYGLGCFEGLKAFPQKDGSLKLFRPYENAERMARSMSGLQMPSFPVETFVEVMKKLIKDNQKMGFSPSYQSQWEKNNFLTAESTYLRPFSYSEGGIGVNLSHNPYFIAIATTVGSYFGSDDFSLTVSNMSRATPNGTGWIKAASNYVIPALAKNKANKDGFMEVLFLDAREQKYVEECSSCNIFFKTKDGKLITPSLEDTILPGITRKTIIELARSWNISVEERKISLEEVLENTDECFLTGTAVGLCPVTSLTTQTKSISFSSKKTGALSVDLLHHLKSVQYGLKEDSLNWMIPVL